MRKITISLLFSLLLMNLAKAQTSSNSPFTRFGLGELTNFSTPYNLAMGGAFSAVRTGTNVNIANPASYTASPIQSFLFEFGFQNKNSFYKEGDNTAFTSDGNFSFLTAQFPVTKWWSSAFGIIPYSVMGYNINHYDQTSQTDSALINYKGTGGLNTVFWGNSFEIFRKISIGINANFLYGKNELVSSTTMFSNNFQGVLINKSQYYFNEFSYRLGLQYYDSLFQKYNFVIGATFENQTKLNASSSKQTINYLLINNVQYNDTFFSSETENDLIELPSYFSAGFALKKGTQLSISADYYMRDWTGAVFLNNAMEGYNKEFGYILGTEIIPNLGTAQFWRNIRYRFGVYYKQTNMKIEDNALMDMGIALGLGLPIKVSNTITNLTINLGQRYTQNPSTLKEYYANFHLDLSLGEIWFVKRKFN